MAIKLVLSSPEAKLLYALLDAAEDEGRLKNTSFAARWLALKRSAESVFAQMDRGDLYLLVEEIAAAGLLKDSWMHERWLGVMRRVQMSPMQSSASQAPFPVKS